MRKLIGLISLTLLACSQQSAVTPLNQTRIPASDPTTPEITGLDRHPDYPFHRPSLARLARCPQPESAAAKIPLTRKYVAAVAARLFSSNPEIFRGYYAPDRLCVDVKTGSAGAESSDFQGYVAIGSDFIAKAKSDAQVAAALAHELGHVVNLHGGAGDYVHARRALADARYTEVLQAKNATHLRQLRAIRAALADLREALKPTPFTDALDGVVESSDFMGWLVAQREPLLTDEEKPFRDYLATQVPMLPLLLRQISGGRGVPESVLERVKVVEAALAQYRPRDATLALREMEKNILGEDAGLWPEIEAESTGLHLLLLAGIHRQGAVELFSTGVDWAAGREQYPSMQACLAAIDAGVVPEKNWTNRQEHFPHPSPCWRIYHLQVLQTERYQASAPQLLKQGDADFVRDPLLADVQTELSE